MLDWQDVPKIKGAVWFFDVGTRGIIGGKWKTRIPWKNGRSILSFTRYFVPYRCMIGQLLLAMLVGSLIQMVLPFLSQAMVDQGIDGRNLDIITLILLAQLGFFKWPR